jgi:hypothetical protein
VAVVVERVTMERRRGDGGKDDAVKLIGCYRWWWQRRSNCSIFHQEWWRSAMVGLGFSGCLRAVTVTMDSTSTTLEGSLEGGSQLDCCDGDGCVVGPWTIDRIGGR